MNTKASLSLVVLSAVILSACTTKTPTVIDTQAENATSTEQSSTSLRDLLALGKSQKCIVTASTVDDDGTKTDTSGTIYISGKKFAQEVAVTSTDKEMPPVNMRMVSDGEYMYTWNTQSKQQGMKFKMTEPENDNADKSTNSNGSISLDDKLNVNCSNWIVDNSKFEVPADVQFSDLSEMMKNIPTMPANIPTIPAE